MKNAAKRILFDIIGLACCLVPPLIVTLQYYPLWRDTVGVGAIAGGTAAILAVVTFAVLGRYIKMRIKSPSPVFLFLILYALFVLIEKVVSGLKVITFWGFIGSAVGAVFFWLSDRYKDKGGK